MEDLKFTEQFYKYEKALLRDAQTLTFKKNQTLFYEGHQPYGIFILLSGELGFTFEDKNCSEENLLPLGKGFAVCIKSFVTAKTYPCTCRALTDCTTLFLTKTQLVDIFLLTNPKS